MAAMLRREEELRLSTEVQEHYAAVEVDSSEQDWMDVTVELQRRVVREFGASEHEEGAALAALREGALQCETGFTPLYVKYQRARRGDLAVGDAAVNCELLQLDGRGTTLLSEVSEGQPTCVLAGSYS